MKEQLVTFETAKLAKEKGFNYKCRAYFNETGNRIHHVEDKDYNGVLYKEAKYYEKCDFYSSPTQSLLQKWLREEHDMLVLIDTDFFNLIWKIIIPDHELPQKFVSEGNYNTYEEALEIGLKEGLKLIENG